jgi:GNAT superfamily N-acetyltransferase
MDENKLTMEIRIAVPADNILLAEIGAQTFAETFGPDNTPENMAAYLAESFSPEKQAAELADPATVFLIAEVDEAAVGYARLREGDPPTYKFGSRAIEIVRIYACQAWLGKGVGPALMQACLRQAEQRGCDTIWLDVWERNPRGIAFYQKWGFVVTGTQGFKLGADLQTDLIMQRRVT